MPPFKRGGGCPISGRMDLRLATYNIRKCVGLDWRRQPDRTLRVLVGIDADVVALQEADKRMGTRPAALPASMVDSHSHYKVLPLPALGTNVGWHGNAILARKEAEVDAVHQIDLPGLEPRGALSVDLHLGRARFRVVAVHLGLRRGDRLGQIGRLRAWLAAQHPMTTVMMGDFNDWSGAGGLDLHLPEFTVLTPGRSFHASMPVAALDRIALGDGVKVRDQGVYRQGEARVASDHLPVWADVTMPGKG